MTSATNDGGLGHAGDALRAIAVASAALYPQEACGFVLGYERVVECTNAAREPLDAFYIQSEEAERWWKTGEVTAVWHSHPRDPAVPSQRDQEMAVPGLGFWIYSLPDAALGVYVRDEEGQLRLKGMLSGDEDTGG